MTESTNLHYSFRVNHEKTFNMETNWTTNHLTYASFYLENQKPHRSLIESPKNCSSIYLDSQILIGNLGCGIEQMEKARFHLKLKC